MKTKLFILPLLFLLLIGANMFAQDNSGKDKSVNTYLSKADKMPEPVGGIAAIMNKIHYPEIARRAGIQGKVYVVAKINEKGIVPDARIIRGIGSGCDVTALNAVKQTKFTPGENKGMAVKVKITVPVLFKLNNGKKETK